MTIRKVEFRSSYRQVFYYSIFRSDRDFSSQMAIRQTTGEYYIPSELDSAAVLDAWRAYETEKANEFERWFRAKNFSDRHASGFASTVPSTRVEWIG